MTTATTPEVDLAKVEGLVGHLVGLMTGPAVSAAVALGDRLGLYRAMNGRARMARFAGCGRTRDL